jgi:hypothetical protein
MQQTHIKILNRNFFIYVLTPMYATYTVITQVCSTNKFSSQNRNAVVSKAKNH